MFLYRVFFPLFIREFKFSFLKFSIFFVYIPNDLPFLDPCPISPISPLPSAHSPINPLLLICLGNPIKLLQDQGPLLPSSSELFDI